MKKVKQVKNIAVNVFNTPLALVIWGTLMLIVPNIVLDITETYSTMWKISNIALPAGIYLLLYSAWKRTGIITLLTLPLMVLASFQLVLTYLYGESIIAVDMFLNVVTTNMSEATELLANILPAIVAVIILYLPLLCWGIYAVCRRMCLNKAVRRETAIWGASMALFGGAVAAIASFYAPEGTSDSFSRCIFPVNVIENMCEAVNRTRQTAHYPQTSEGFRFDAVSSAPADEREIYVLIIGETSRAINWQINGYDRPTNPRLSARPDLYFFRKAISESNTTHKSVPMLISHLNAETFDSIPNVKSILTAMKEAGFYTRFYSNQAPNRSYTEFFGNEADDVRYTDQDAEQHPYDKTLAKWVDAAVADTTITKQFILLHSYGSHFLYSDRYPREDAFFLPDDNIDAKPSHRDDLINTYDNTIRYTDGFIDDVICSLEKSGCRSALVYSSDHGEDIFDDKRERFLHASPNPTYYQLHVGMLAWVSPTLAEESPSMVSALTANTDSIVSPQRSIFPTVLAMAGVKTPRCNGNFALTSSNYIPGRPVYLNDLNKALPLKRSGLKKQDIKLIDGLLGN